MSKKRKKIQSKWVVIGIIALLLVIVVGGVLTGLFNEILESRWPPLGIEPSPSDPLRIAPPTVTAGKKTRMTIGYYNTEQADVPESIMPQISCTGIESIEVVASGLNILQEMTGEYATSVSIPRDTPSGYYPCLLTVSHTQKAFFLEVAQYR